MRVYPHADVLILMQMVRCGYTADSLSEETTISSAVLHEILTGRAKTISTRNICALATAFNFSFAEFIDLLSSAASSSPFFAN